MTEQEHLSWRDDSVTIIGVVGVVILLIYNGENYLSALLLWTLTILAAGSIARRI